MGFNVTSLLVDSFVDQLRKGYEKTYGHMNENYKEIICWAAGMALDIIANSDALYHNVKHTIHVTLVGQEILRGKHIREGGVTSEDWLHCIISLLCHDIGYVKGVCRHDDREAGVYATGRGDEVVKIDENATDASLTPYHVDRGKLFIAERFSNHNIINVEKIQKNIELTRFPVPHGEDHKDTKGYPGIVRGADLCGQMCDPRYLQKIAALYYEFVETGTAQKLGYTSPGALKKNYPKFYWKSVYPYIKHSLSYLNTTQEGKSYVSGLYSNVFSLEHSVDPTPEEDDSAIREE
ncbi:hypothetical protein C9374_009535 [Naegleria lovaniensis]|uniref:Metal-dependent phosphohydrolase n=1 Tax=Naegleria lovaniensis TaxID=51637 RepID=A0AA88GXQ8_NAELO|nr:uncharacterized protein C9374_009535 [Naegleria lovaniensis]KAG2392958.1 hypothetical protein C9374_009535 [Naegleria lovaniensis]